jgi:Xaa-Pro aminopeptidase
MASKRATGPLLAALREHMRSKKHFQEVIHAYIIPTGDAHQSEYVAECDKRREYISGFSGSAGTAVVTLNKALLWTDGRYHLQASQQLDENWTLMKDGLPDVLKMEEWLSKELPGESCVGIDPFLMMAEQYKRIEELLSCSNKKLVSVATNLVDLVWEAEGTRPPQPSAPVFVHPLKYAGKSWSSKVTNIRKKMKEKECKGLVATALDEVAWLLNLRGRDVEYNPVFFSYVLITMDTVRLFINQEKLSDDVRRHLLGGEDGQVVSVYGYEDIMDHVKQLVVEETEGKIWISKSCSQALVGLVPKLVGEMCPIQMMKAVKNSVEIEGMRQAHVRDAVALCQYFAWLEREVPKGKLTEVSAADQLEAFRREAPECVDLSFPTISSSGPNGAVIHYRPTPGADRSLSVDEMYLCDSGAQYWDGTTDVTRTMHFGTPTQFQKECFTRVLKGVIRLATAVFPTKIDGHRLESFARASLWEAGLDYLHGTGHGVGAFLNVHEGPCGINSRPSKGPLEAGMFLSDEPGFYEDGSFGIRTENIIQIVEASTPYRFKNKQFLTTDTITLCPIQQKMIVPELLTAQEVAWLNDYHTKCFEVVGPLLKERGKLEAYKWLQEQTALIG